MNKGFLILPHEFTRVWQPYLISKERNSAIVYIYLADFENNTRDDGKYGYAYPSHRYIEVMLQIGKNSIVKSISLLAKEGLITVVKKPALNGLKNYYIIRDPIPLPHEDVWAFYKGRLLKLKNSKGNSLKMNERVAALTKRIPEPRPKKQKIKKEPKTKKERKVNSFTLGVYWLDAHHRLLNAPYGSEPTGVDLKHLAEMLKSSGDDSYFMERTIDWYLTNFSIVPGHNREPTIRGLYGWRTTIFAMASGVISTPKSKKEKGEWAGDKLPRATL